MEDGIEMIVGSSNINKSHCFTSVIASANLLFSPPDSVLILLSRLSIPSFDNIALFSYSLSTFDSFKAVSIILAFSSNFGC